MTRIVGRVVVVTVMLVRKSLSQTWDRGGKFLQVSVIRGLEDLGYEAVCPRLLTCNNDVPPTKTLGDDVALIRKTAQSLLDDGKTVIAVMHSYGGVVGTDALHGLAIKHLIYMTAFIPPSGSSLAGMFGGQLPPFITVDVCRLLPKLICTRSQVFLG